MHYRRWNIKRLSLVGCACLVFYLVFSSGFHRYQIEGVISDARPEDVWNYVADFSKMRLLNPTILNFKVISDSGNTHDWRYTVSYTERLSHWPYWLNTATGEYVVTQTMPGVVPPLYAIESKHQTCFLSGVYCLRAVSTFEFRAQGRDTYCVEKIDYQCPPFLSGACRRELEYQRRAVIHNLTMVFSKKHDNNNNNS